MGKKWANRWYWFCSYADSRHGCWHADYEGRCEAHSRGIGFETKEEAEKAGQGHLYRKHNIYTERWTGNISVYSKRTKLK